MEIAPCEEDVIEESITVTTFDKRIVIPRMVLYGYMCKKKKICQSTKIASLVW